MRYLEKEFTGKGEVKGFMFTQLKKSNYAYLYKVDDGFRCWYEIFERKINVRFDCESYPRSKSFGKWAWTTKFKERAYDIFETINTKVSARQFREVDNG